MKVGGIAVDQLRSIVSRVEALEEEKRGVGDAIKDVYAEASGNGFDKEAIRAVVKLRKLDAQEREEKENILDTYKRCLGLLPELDETA